MPASRPNRGAAPQISQRLLRAEHAEVPTLQMSLRDLKEGMKALDDWHWNLGQPGQLLEWKDPDIDQVKPHLITCGLFIAAHVRAPRTQDKHPRRERDTRLELSRAMSAQSYLAFDRKHPHQRLYVLTRPQVQRAVRAKLWEPNSSPAMKLSQLAMIAGGRHADGKYPDVTVKPIGIMTAVIYWTHKRTNPPSYYLHKFGEVSHFYPILSCDAQGRLWVAGGNYTSPNPGITD